MLSLTSLFNVNINEASAASKEQTLVFRDTSPDWQYEVPSTPDPTFMSADMADASLENFLSRPIKIQSFSWNVGGSFYQSFNPWSNFFGGKRVINRINNFFLMRCKLHVKIVINGNAFYYGRLLASYQPLHLQDQFTLDRPSVFQDNIEASQRPHVYIDPTTSQGGTLHLPFVYNSNALSVVNANWEEMGVMSIRMLQTLKHANGAGDPVTVNVFAWATDVDLSIPTSFNSASIVPQSGDEYTLGPVSQPSAALARVAAKLSDIPYIRPYALATEMVANTVASLARAFGYSRPVVVDKIMPMRPTFGNFVNANAPDTAVKLTLDCKQETSIDSRVVGLSGQDEMTIRSISTREAFLTSFPWGLADVPETQLFTTYVTPVTWNVGLGTEYHITPCAFATIPFKYWRGSLRYRFQVVSSNFHKGRIKVVWDPYAFGSNEYNVNYVRIFDISTEKDFTVTVGWGNKRPFLEHYSPGDPLPLSLTKPWATGSATTLTADTNYANGVLSVYVVNDLTVPMDTINNDIEINVFVSSADDYEVVEPQNCKLRNFAWIPPAPITLAPIVPQSGMTGECDMTNQTDSRPMQIDDGELVSTKLHGTSDIYKVMFADPITSVRQVVKRYCYCKGFITPLTGPANNAAWNSFIFPDFPPYRGTVTAPEGIDTAGTKNLVAMTILNWFTPAYVCRRGGMRWKHFTPPQAGTAALASYISVKREPCATGYAYVYVPATLASFPSDAQAFPGTWDGAQVQSNMNNAILETDHPFFINRRFWSGKWRNMTTNNTATTFHSFTTGLGSSPSATLTYVAAGDDFDLSFFTGAPILYYIGPSA